MSRVGFEPMTTVFERAKIFHALNRAATVMFLTNAFSATCVEVVRDDTYMRKDINPHYKFTLNWTETAYKYVLYLCVQ
jgi:hypothetical protein